MKAIRHGDVVKAQDANADIRPWVQIGEAAMAAIARLAWGFGVTDERADRRRGDDDSGGD